MLFLGSLHSFFGYWPRPLQCIENDREALSMEVRKFQLLLYEERKRNEIVQKPVNDSHNEKAIYLSSLLPILLL